MAAGLCKDFFPRFFLWLDILDRLMSLICHDLSHIFEVETSSYPFRFWCRCFFVKAMRSTSPAQQKFFKFYQGEVERSFIRSRRQGEEVSLRVGVHSRGTQFSLDHGCSLPCYIIWFQWMVKFNEK